MRVRRHRRTALAALAMVAVLLPGSVVAQGGGDRFPVVVDDWAYQLQGYDRDLGTVGASRYDLVVIDYARFGDAASEWPVATIEALKADGPCGRRVVLAYMSIGEAETYRFYWDDAWVDGRGRLTDRAPGFLGPFNPDFPDNYEVRYWRRDWQRILFGDRSGAAKSYLDRILDAGFDGVYLDIVDGFEHWGPRSVGGNGEQPRAAKRMVTLVRRIARYARDTRGRPDFLVVPQNGATIIAPAAHTYAADPEAAAERQRRRYFRVVDAIGAEDSFYFGDRDQNNRLDPQEETIALLDRFAGAGKTVLAIDYLTRAAKVRSFVGRALERGWVPYVSVRDLDRLTVPAAFPPSCGP